jgi:hypothetical protein
MKKKTAMCHYCNRHVITVVDYRTFNGVTSKYFSCDWCRGLNNKTIRKIQEEGLDPLDFYTTKHRRK